MVVCAQYLQNLDYQEPSVTHQVNTKGFSNQPEANAQQSVVSTSERLHACTHALCRVYFKTREIACWALRCRLPFAFAFAFARLY
jgi:hypothetical protein